MGKQSHPLDYFGPGAAPREDLRRFGPPPWSGEELVLLCALFAVLAVPILCIVFLIFMIALGKFDGV